MAEAAAAGQQGLKTGPAGRLPWERRRQPLHTRASQVAESIHTNARSQARNEPRLN